jgi:hypothetical protein
MPLLFQLPNTGKNARFAHCSEVLGTDFRRLRAAERRAPVLIIAQKSYSEQ